MRRFFAPPDNLSDHKIDLSFEESRHLRDALRLREGARVSVFDGEGNEYLCIVELVGRKNEKAQLLVREKIAAPAPESNLNLTLAAALLKGEKFDLVVQKATELGVKRIVPLIVKRADVRLSDERDAIRKTERWQRIAVEAIKQCGRALIPTIEKPVFFAEFISKPYENETRVFFAERNGENLHQSLPKTVSSLTAIIGAEGGWEESEIEAARQNQCRLVTLGGRILRAETAAITATVLLQHLYGDLR